MSFFSFISILIISNSVFAQSRPYSARKGGSGETRSSSFIGLNSSTIMTDDMYAPKAGGSNLIFNLALPMGNIDSTSTGGTKATYSGNNMTLEYGYGYSDKITFYLSVINAGQITTFNTNPQTTSKLSGLNDGTFGMKGISNNSGSFFYYDFSYNTSLATVKSDIVTGETTGGSIRPSLNIKLGGGLPLAGLTVGTKLTYSLYQPGTYAVTMSGIPFLTTNYKAGNGSAWKLFLQTNTSWKCGLSYEEVNVDPIDIEILGIKGQLTATTMQLTSLYTLTSLSPTTEMTLKIEKPVQKGSTSSYNAFNLMGIFRFNF